MVKYKDIKLDNIVGHDIVSSEIVRPNDPKIDPGKGFRWDYFRGELDRSYKIRTASFTI
jgi:N-acetyl-anhydromuramyl-L-alanine amidase AmpD